MKREVPMELRPRLRFPEFREAKGWARVPLNSVLSEDKIKSDGKAEVHSVSLTKGIVSQVEHMGRSFSAADTSRYSLVRPFDVVYTKSPLAIFKLGIVKQHRGPHNALVSPLYGVFTPANRHIGQLIEAYFDSPSRSLRFLDPLAQKGAKNTIQISNEKFLSGELFLPSDEREQKKIADCLGSLDDLIAAEGRKLVALREHKRGLLRNVLPQDGNVQPAVRFSQYRDAEAWNVIRLGDIADYENGKAYEKDIVDNGRFVVVNARFISTDGVVRKYTNETYCIAQTSDVLMVLSDLPSAKALARCFFVDADDTYAVNQRVAKLRPRSVDSRFLLYALDQHPWLMAFSDGINQTHLSKGSVLDCPLAVPRDDGEQKLIGECLGAIDSRVAAQEAKLAALTRHKTGLLQQLFPSPEEESR